MWIIRWTIIGFVMLAVLGFALQNTATVDLRIWTWESGNTPLYLVAYFAFAAGILVAALVAAINQVQQKVVHYRSKREIKRLKEELSRLRRISLDEALLDDDDEENDDSDLAGKSKK